MQYVSVPTGIMIIISGALLPTYPLALSLDHSRRPTMRAGLPATTTPGATSRTTTARAPRMAKSPTLTLGPTNASAHIQTPRPIVIVPLTRGRIRPPMIVGSGAQMRSLRDGRLRADFGLARDCKPSHSHQWQPRHRSKDSTESRSGRCGEYVPPVQSGPRKVAATTAVSPSIDVGLDIRPAARVPRQIDGTVPSTST